MDIHIGQRIVALRKELDLDQAQFAELLGLTQSRVSQIEDSPWLQKRTLDRVVERTGRSLAELLGLSPTPAREEEEWAAAQARVAEAGQRLATFVEAVLDSMERRAAKGEVVALCDEVVGLTRALPDEWAQQLLGRTLLRLADVRESLGEYTSARASLQAGLKLAEERHDEAGRLNCIYKLGVLCYRSGDYDQALAYFAEAAQSSSLEARWRGLVGQSTVQEQRGDFEAALRSLEEAWALLPRETQEAASAARLYIDSARANVWLARGDYVQAEKFSRLALATAEEAQDRGAQQEEKTNLALCRHHRGFSDEAVALLTAAQRQPGAADDRRRWCLVRAVEAQVRAARGEAAEAVEAGEEALRVAQEIGEPICQFYAHLGLGDAYLVRSPHRAFHHFQQAAALATAGHMRKYEAEAWQRLAQFHQTVGETEEAIDLAQRAVATARELGAAHVQAAALATLAQAQAARGEEAVAEAAAREALRLAQEYDLARLRAEVEATFPDLAAADPSPTGGSGT